MKTMISSSKTTKAAAPGHISRTPSRPARLSTRALARDTTTKQQQQVSSIRTALAKSIKAKADLAWFENLACGCPPSRRNRHRCAHQKICL